MLLAACSREPLPPIPTPPPKPPIPPIELLFKVDGVTLHMDGELKAGAHFTAAEAKSQMQVAADILDRL